jgi:hypothetical protein
MEDVLVKLSVGLLWLKLRLTRRGLFLLAHWTWKNREVLRLVLKLGRFRQWIRNTWKVLKCGAGGGLKKSVGLIM